MDTSFDENKKRIRVVAIVSGGPDSVCSLVYWISRGYDASVLFFNYGQKALVKEKEVLTKIIKKLNEISSAKMWGKIVEVVELDMTFMKKLWLGTQLTDERIEVKLDYEPTVVVPIRNIVMSTIAVAYAYTLLELNKCDKTVIVLGSQYDDTKIREDTWEPRYPDCSPECFIAIEAAYKICHFREKRNIEIWTPSIAMIRKNQLLKSCYELIGDLIYETWSCYQGYELHCGKCESCNNRIKAFKEAGLIDKTKYLT